MRGRSSLGPAEGRRPTPTNWGGGAYGGAYGEQRFFSSRAGVVSRVMCIFSADGVYRCPASHDGGLWGPVFGNDAAKGEDDPATDGRSFQALATVAALREAKVTVNSTGPQKGPDGSGSGSGRVTAVVVPPAGG